MLWVTAREHRSRRQQRNFRRLTSQVNENDPRTAVVDLAPKSDRRLLARERAPREVMRRERSQIVDPYVEQALVDGPRVAAWQLTAALEPAEEAGAEIEERVMIAIGRGLAARAARARAASAGPIARGTGSAALCRRRLRHSRAHVNCRDLFS